MTKATRAAVLVVCLALTLGTGIATAANGVLLVKVTDSSGKAQSGATVCLTVNGASGPALAPGFASQTTNADGYTAFYGAMQIWNYVASNGALSNDGSVKWETNTQLLTIQIYPNQNKTCPK